MEKLERVKQLIEKSLPDAFVTVTDMTGDMNHLDLIVASDSFEGKRLIQQHQVVMDILKESLKEDVHAVQIKTMTKVQAKTKGLIS